MHSAIDEKQEDIAVSLINAGVKLNGKDISGETPFIRAIFDKTSPKIVEALLKAGVNPNQKDSVYGTLLDFVIMKDPALEYLPKTREKIVLLLLVLWGKR